jgi:hypothetical protein
MPDALGTESEDEDEPSGAKGTSGSREDGIEASTFAGRYHDEPALAELNHRA